MKVLVIGDAGSIFVKQYIEYLYGNGSNQVVLLREGAVCQNYLDYYDKNHVIVESFSNKATKLVSKIPKIRSCLGCRIWGHYIAKKYGRFDIVHVHGLSVNRANIGKYMRNYTDKLVITVWGDELFRRTDKQLLNYRKYYDRADVITVATKAMYQKFNDFYGEKYLSKLRMNKFAVGVLDKIDTAQNDFSNNELRREFGIENQNKVLVYVGHNGRSAQRHHELTEAVSRLSKEYKDKILLIYTMTYGVPDDKYLKHLVELADSSGCEYVVLREFLNEDKVAKLRAICDIMLHAQLTDAFSASICECLYSGAVVLNGSWLVYSDLPDNDSCFVLYDSLDEIPKKLEYVLDNYENVKEEKKNNKQIIRDICSKEATTEAWENTLDIKN